MTASPHLSGCALVTSMVMHMGLACVAIHWISVGLLPEQDLRRSIQHGQTTLQLVAAYTPPQQETQEEPLPIKPMPMPEVEAEQVALPKPLPEPDESLRRAPQVALVDRAELRLPEPSVPKLPEVERESEQIEAPKPDRPEMAEPIERKPTEDTVVEKTRPDPTQVEMPAMIAPAAEQGIEEAIKAPQAIAQQMPVFHVDIQSSGWEGTVVVGMKIDEEGEVVRVWLVKSGGNNRMDSECLAAVRQWKFQPARQGGEPVEVEREQAFKFYIPK